jgi:hypothetical protein
VPDRYVWISAYVSLAQLETAARQDPGLVAPAAARLYEHAARSDLPEFLAWALVYQAESGDHAKVPLARSAADGIANPDLQSRVQALPGGEPDRRSRGKRLGGMTARRHAYGAAARLPAPAAGPSSPAPADHNGPSPRPADQDRSHAGFGLHQQRLTAAEIGSCRIIISAPASAVEPTTYGPSRSAAVCAAPARTDYEGWQGASRLRVAEYLLCADDDFAATGDTERPVPAPSRSCSG